MMQQLLVYGAGGFAREVSLLVEDINRRSPTWSILGYVTDDPREHGREFRWGRVLGHPADVLRLHTANTPTCTIAMGSPDRLAEKPSLLRQLNAQVQFPVLVHPTATLNKTVVQIGEGSIIAAGCLFTVDITIGSFCVINLGCIVAHDVTIGDCCVLSPRSTVNAGVVMEGDNLIGAAAVIMPRVTIGRGAVVALGAVVGTSVEPYTVVAGNPARVVRRLAPPSQEAAQN